MRCLILTVLLVLAAVPVLAQPKDLLDERILEMITREFPEWKPQEKNIFGASRPSSGIPSLNGTWKDGGKHLHISVQYFNSHKEADESQRWFYTRAIVPPSFPVDGIGRVVGGLQTSGNAEIGFSKANFFISVNYSFPSRPLRKNEYYYNARAPKEEVERVKSIAKKIDAAIDRDRTVTQCYNDFYNPVFPRPTNDVERLLGAAANGDTATVKTLIAAGVDATQLNANGEGLMHVAARYGCLDTVKALIDAKVDVNSRTKRQATPLMIAANAQQLETIKLLMAAGADVKAVDEWGWTTAFYAITYPFMNGPFARWSRERRKEILTTLKDAGLDLNSRARQDQDNLLTRGIFNSGTDVIERWTDLFELGVDINSLGGQGQPVLFRVVRGGAPQERARLVKFLIENGADVNFTDANGMTARKYLLIDREQRAKHPESVKQIDEVIKLLDDAGAAR